MLITAVGPNSQQGRIFTLMRGIEEESGQSHSHTNTVSFPYSILGFITEALKKLRAKCCGEPEPADPENGQGSPQPSHEIQDEEIEVAVQVCTYTHMIVT